MPITAEEYEATINDTELEQTTLESPDNNAPPAEAQTPAPNSEQPPAAQPAFNLDEELVKSTNGAVKSVSDITAILERANKTTELETRLRQFEEENTSLKSKADADPFANDLTKKLNDLYRSGASESQIDSFLALQKVNIDTLSPMDASALALSIKSGITLEEARIYLNDKYGFDPDDPEAKLDRAAEVALKVDSAIDKDFLKAQKAEVSKIPENQAEKEEQLFQQAYTQKLTQLEPIAKNVVSEVLTNSFKGVSINGKDGEGAISVDLPISQESRDNLASTVSKMTEAQWQNWSADDKGKDAIKTFSDNVLVLQNWKNWLIDVASKTELRVRAEYANPGKIDRGKEAPSGGNTKQQEVIDNISEAIGL